MDDIQGILNAMMRTAVDPQTAAVAIASCGSTGGGPVPRTAFAKAG